MSAALAEQDISRFLLQRCYWQRPHQFNKALAPAIAEEKLRVVSGDQLIATLPGYPGHALKNACSNQHQMAMLEILQFVSRRIKRCPTYLSLAATGCPLC
jgi:hypothetical protein